MILLRKGYSPVGWGWVGVRLGWGGVRVGVFCNIKDQFKPINNAKIRLRHPQIKGGGGVSEVGMPSPKYECFLHCSLAFCKYV